MKTSNNNPEKNIDEVKEKAGSLAEKKIKEFLDSLRKGIAEIYDKIDKNIQLTSAEKKILHEFHQQGLYKKIANKLVEVRASKNMVDTRLEKKEALILKIKEQKEKTTNEIKKEELQARINLETDAYKQLLVYRELLEKQEEKLMDALKDLKIKVEVEPLLPVDEEITALLKEAQEAKMTSDQLSGLAEKEEAKAKALKKTGLESLEEED